MLQNHWPHVVQTAMERRTCVIFNVLIVGGVMWYTESYIRGQLIWNLWNSLCNFGILLAEGSQNTEITQLVS